jgi:hypothetical protein
MRDQSPRPPREYREQHRAPNRRGGRHPGSIITEAAKGFS